MGLPGDGIQIPGFIMRKHFTAGLVAAALATAALNASAAGQGLYAGVGTLGINVGYKYGISESLGIRVGANTFKYSGEFKDGSIDYEGDLKLNSVELLADWHPFGGGFALTGGVLLNDNRFEGAARPNTAGTLNINGQEYSGIPGTMPQADVKARFGKGATPYVGLGFTANPAAVKGLRLNAGIGVVFQRPDVKLSVSGVDPSQAQALEADRAAAERSLQKDMESLRHYPVLTIGASYAF